MLKIIDVDYVKDYELLLTFSDGTRKFCDLKPYLTGEVFGELLDRDKFIQYGLTGYTIEWANGADLAPEFLYDIGRAAQFSQTDTKRKAKIQEQSNCYTKVV